MYVRKSTRRRVYRGGVLLVALVVLTPKFELPPAPQLTAILNAVGLRQPPAGQSGSRISSASACITGCGAQALLGI